MKKRILFVTSLCMMLFFAVIPTKASEVDSGEAELTANQVLAASMSDEAASAITAVSPKLKATTVVAPDLTVANLSSSIKVYWNKVASADGYYIYRKTADGNWSETPYKKITKNSTTSFEDKDYKAGTGYYYRAVSYKKVDGKTVTSDYSEERYIKRLSRPTLTRDRGNGFITIKWEKISGATGYIVYRDGKQVAKTTNLYYHDTNVKSGTEYSYTAKAYYESTSGNLFYSALSKAKETYGKKISLTSPVCELENTGTSIRVSWSPVPRAGGYYIYRRAEGSDWNPIPIARVVGNPSHQYYDKDFVKGTLYYYQVRPYRTYSGERIAGDASKEKRIMRLSRPTVTVSNAASGVKLTWNEIAGAQRYAIYRDGDRIGSTEDLSYIDTKITNGTKYVYEVRAYYALTADDNCFSEYSYTDTIYRLKNMVVTELKAGPERFKVTYEKNSKATGYEVVYSRNEDFSNSKTVKVTSVSTLSKTVKYLEAEEPYYVKVRSYKKVGSKYYYSNYSNVQMIITE